MQLDEFDLNLYKVFLAVAKCKNITKAASMLYVSQPAISYSIKSLESKIGCKLFIRNAGGVELTYEGNKLLYYVENAFSYLKIGNSVINEDINMINGTISIGVPTHIGIYFVNKHIQKFNEKYPGIKFVIVNKSTNELIKMLEVNELDIIVDSYPVESSKNDLTYYDLGEIENCFVGNSKYKQIGNKIYTIKDLNKFPLLLPGKKTSTYRLLTEQVKGAEELEPIIEVSTTEVMLDLVTKGLGIGYFNKPSVLKKLNNKELYEIPLNVELPKTKICLAYFEDFITNAIRLFIKQVKKENERNNNLQKKEIRLIVTQNCPFKCNFCHREGIYNNKEELLTPDDISYMYKMFNRTIGTSSVHITGGEPLLYGKLNELCEKLKKQVCDITITTNGYTLDSNYDIGKYINRINFSIHSMIKSEFDKNSSVNGSYEKVIANITRFNSMYPLVEKSINITYLNSLNVGDDNLNKLLAFAESMKSNVKVIELYPKDSGEHKNITELESFLKHKNFEKGETNFRKIKYSKKNMDVYLTRCTCNEAVKYEKPSEKCNINNDFYITLDGKINLCRNTNDTIDLYDVIKNRDDLKMTELILEACDKLGNNCPLEEK